MRFTSRQLRQVARRADLSEKALRRLLGSVPVRVKRQVVSDQEGRVEVKIDYYNLGLRLTEELRTKNRDSAAYVDALVAALVQYKKHCSLVYSWLVSGAFDPTKPPDRINRSYLQHASRTAGRLRASLLRT